MNRLQQHLLMAVALGLCCLCVYQWYGQTLQRNALQQLQRVAYQQSVAVQGDTNSIRTMDGQIVQMDTRLTQLKAAGKTNADLVAAQKRQIALLQATAETLTNRIAGYQNAIERLQGQLKDAYDGLWKQSAALKEVVAQRDDFVNKLNDAVRERNGIVSKYNELVSQVEKSRGAGSKP